ncbi:hypothetical protein [Bosea sp. 2RAB26]|uniref:hypothetical protein n=1 Tax=Bosea sp. 2RAB26 TaxID=3237476 RepID=UPI003F93CF52
MTRKRSQFPQPSCLFPDEKELGHLLLGKDRAHMWPAIAKAEEKAGLPRVSLQYGGRYFPAVRQFFDRRYGVHDEEMPFEDERAKENWERAPTPRRRRPPSS